METDLQRDGNLTPPKQNDRMTQIADNPGLFEAFRGYLRIRFEFQKTFDVDFVPGNAAEIGEATLEGKLAEEGQVSTLMIEAPT
jgi:hypothetical protein